VKDFAVREAREFIRKKCARQRAENRRLFEKAWQDFDRIVELIIENYNPMRIYQWGSLLTQRHFCGISDIDIAVEDIGSAEQYFRMIGESAELTSFPLDIVELEKIDPVHAESIRTKGRLVYERKRYHSGADRRNKKNPDYS